jgi:hypothetical protein
MSLRWRCRKIHRPYEEACMESESKDRDDRRAPEEPEEEHPQERTASELSGRSADSVGRRYDATKETYQEVRGDGGDEDEDSRG